MRLKRIIRPGVLGTGLGGKPIESAMPAYVNYRYNAPGTFEIMFVANRACRVTSITHRVEVVGSDGGAVSAVINKNADTKAYNDASIKPMHSGSLNLKGTADTKQIPTLTTTPADLSLAAGDALYLVPTGTTTAAKGVISIEIVPLA